MYLHKFHTLLSLASIPSWMIAGNRIQGGTDAQAPIPWQVAVRFNGNKYCGGTIIDAKTIVTAAHCINQIGSTLEVEYFVLNNSYENFCKHNNFVKRFAMRLLRFCLTFSVALLDSHNSHDQNCWKLLFWKFLQVFSDKLRESSSSTSGDCLLWGN